MRGDSTMGLVALAMLAAACGGNPATQRAAARPEVVPAPSARPLGDSELRWQRVAAAAVELRRALGMSLREVATCARSVDELATHRPCESSAPGVLAPSFEDVSRLAWWAWQSESTGQSQPSPPGLPAAPAETLVLELDRARELVTRLESLCPQQELGEVCVGASVEATRFQLVAALLAETASIADLVKEPGHGWAADQVFVRSHRMVTPPGFELLNVDPRRDGFEARRFRGQRGGAAAGAELLVRAPDGFLAGEERVCRPLDRLAAQLPGGPPVLRTVNPMVGRAIPSCERLGEWQGRSTSVWVEADQQPLLFALVVPSDRFGAARRAAGVASLSAWVDIGDATSRPALLQLVLERNRTAAEGGLPRPSLDGIVALEPRPSPEAPHTYVWRTWRSSTRAGWDIATNSLVRLDDHGSYVVRLAPPRVSSSSVEGTEPWGAPRVPSFVFDRIHEGGNTTLAEELASACPALAPLLRGPAAPLALVDDCARPETHCTFATRGTLRTVSDFSSQREPARTSMQRSLHVDLARCVFRGWSQEATSTGRFKTVTYWSNSTEAVSDSDDPFEGIAWRPRPTGPLYPDGPTRRGPQLDSQAAEPVACDPTIPVSAARVIAGAWQAGWPAPIPARRAAQRRPPATPPGCLAAASGQIAYDAAQSFAPWVRSGRYTFLLASPHLPWGGGTLAVYDAVSDRSRILLDATIDPLLGTILIHDVQETAVLVSVTTGSPYDRVPRRVFFFVLDVERGLGGPLLVHTEIAPSTPVAPSPDGDQLIGASRTSEGMVELSETVADRECVRRAPLAELQRAL